MKRISFYLSTAVITFLMGVFLPLIYTFNQSGFKSSPAEFNEKLSSPLTKQKFIQSQETVRENNEQLTYIGCWNGGRGGRLKITNSQIFDIGSKEDSDYHLFSVSNFDNRKEFVLKASKKYWKSFLSKFIKISFYQTGGVGISSYESKEDLLADDFHGAGQFEEVPCK